MACQHIHGHTGSVLHFCTHPHLLKNHITLSGPKLQTNQVNGLGQHVDYDRTLAEDPGHEDQDTILFPFHKKHISEDTQEMPQL